MSRMAMRRQSIDPMFSIGYREIYRIGMVTTRRREMEFIIAIFKILDFTKRRVT